MERVIRIEVSPVKGKKYRAHVRGRTTRTVDFGASAYQQFKDSTRLKKYRHLDHNDPKRRRNYFMRHSGVASKRQALARERAKSRGKITAKILSHQYLW